MSSSAKKILFRATDSFIGHPLTRECFVSTLYKSHDFQIAYLNFNNIDGLLIQSEDNQRSCG